MNSEMKLILAIVSNENANKLQKNLNQESFFHTRLSTKGGFLEEKNVTFVIGLAQEKVDRVLEIIKINSPTKKQLISLDMHPEFEFLASSLPPEITVGGATVFILNVEQFLKL